MKDVRVAKELTTTITNSVHEVLDKVSKSGLLGSPGLHLVPNGGNFFISGYATNKAHVLNLQQGKSTWEGRSGHDHSSCSTGCGHAFLSDPNNGFNNSGDIIPPWV